MPSSHFILCHPLLLLPPIPPSIRVFSNESTLRMRWPKYWSFSFSIIPSKEIPGLISFRMDWLDLLAVQGTLKSLLQHHSSKASILRCSAFFTVQFFTSIHDHGKNQCGWLRRLTERGRLRRAHRVRLRGPTPRPRSGVEAGRTPCPRDRGQEELPHVRGQGRQPRGAISRPRSGAAAESARLPQRRSSQEELPHV